MGTKQGRGVKKGEKVEETTPDDRHYFFSKIKLIKKKKRTACSEESCAINQMCFCFIGDL